MSRESDVQKYNAVLKRDPSYRYRDVQYLEAYIAKWRTSRRRRRMEVGNDYYRGKQDILQRVRTTIGPDGNIEEVTNLPNNKIVDNQYLKLVDQKVNYVLSKQITFEGDDEEYIDRLDEIFGKEFHRTIKNIGKDSYNCGIGWLYVYVDEQGEFKFKRFDPVNVISFWKDDDRTELEFIIRIYETKVWINQVEEDILKAEVYSPEGIDCYTLMNGALIFEETKPYLYIHNEDGGTQPAKWNKFPVIPFKGNGEELPLIVRCKCLQDAINTLMSDFQNAMQEDGGNTILILENFEGENLAEFRRNLSTYRAVKVCSGAMDGGKGDVRKLEIEVNAQNYKDILEIFKKSMIENCKGIDVKDDTLSSNPNQMNIQCMYFDIDQDANELETEYQCSFEKLLWFVRCYEGMQQPVATETGEKKKQRPIKVIFNRDIMMNESVIVENCMKSVGIISNETIISMHPWTTNVEAELKRLEEQQKKEMEQYVMQAAVDQASYENNQKEGKANAGAKEPGK